MPEESYEAGIVYQLFAELGLHILQLAPTQYEYKWRGQERVGTFETRQAAVQAAFADAIDTMKQRNTMQRELEGLRAENEVACI